MRKILALSLSLFFLLINLPIASAENSVVRITSTLHQNFTGEFLNDDLAQQLTPSGALGQLVFTPFKKSKTWVIDPALIDEVVAMSGDYVIDGGATSSGKEIALSWLTQLKEITADNEVIALAYGNPDVALAKRLAPSELRAYFAYGKTSLELALGRSVRSEPNQRWSSGKSKLSSDLSRNYADARKDLTRLSRVVTSPDLEKLRMSLARLLSPSLSMEERTAFSLNARAAVDAQVRKLRIVPGKYQLTTEMSTLPVTIINDFPVEVTVNIRMVTGNARIIVDNFTGVVLPALSKLQLEVNAFVIAPGQTVVLARITDTLGKSVVPSAVLALNATVIDSRVTWLTTGAAILLLLAAIVQSVRRIKRGRKVEI
jgi:hypothetical protein